MCIESVDIVTRSPSARGRRPRERERRTRKELHVPLPAHAHDEPHRVAHARGRAVHARAQSQRPHSAHPIHGPPRLWRLERDDDRAVAAQLEALLAAEEAVRKRHRVEQPRGRDRDAPGTQRKDRPLIDVRLVLVPLRVAERKARERRRRLVGHHRAHLRRERLHAAHAIAHRLVEEDAELVVRLLADVDRFRLHEHAKVHERARVELCARDDRRRIACDGLARSALRHGELCEDRDEGDDHQSFPAGGRSG